MTRNCLSGEVIKSHTTHSDVAGQIVLDDAECRVAEEVWEASWREKSVMRSVSDCVCAETVALFDTSDGEQLPSRPHRKTLGTESSPSARLLSHTDKDIRKEAPTEELDESFTCLAEVCCVDSRLSRDVLEGLCGRRDQCGSPRHQETAGLGRTIVIFLKNGVSADMVVRWNDIGLGVCSIDEDVSTRTRSTRPSPSSGDNDGHATSNHAVGLIKLCVGMSVYDVLWSVPKSQPRCHRQLATGRT
jgi:hypothetical protein